MDAYTYKSTLKGLVSRILHIPEFRQLRIDEPVTYFPNQPEFASSFSIVTPISTEEILSNMAKNGCSGFQYKSANEYILSYKSNTSDPVKMAKNLIQNIKLMNACLNGISDWDEKLILDQGSGSKASG